MTPRDPLDSLPGTGNRQARLPSPDVVKARTAAIRLHWFAGYVSEYCPRLAGWIAGVTDTLRRGAVMWFDYGLPRQQYYLPERHDGTLVCHFRHQLSEDPFANVGLQDITAWVDFTRVAEGCSAANLEVAGFTTQAHFLAASGIDREMQLAAEGDEGLFARLANQARTHRNIRLCYHHPRRQQLAHELFLSHPADRKFIGMREVEDDAVDFNLH